VILFCLHSTTSLSRVGIPGHNGFAVRTNTTVSSLVNVLTKLKGISTFAHVYFTTQFFSDRGDEKSPDLIGRNLNNAESAPGSRLPHAARLALLSLSSYLCRLPARLLPAPPSGRFLSGSHRLLA
jgi:hypothetical protein